MFTECMEVSGTVLRLSTCLSEILSLTLPTSFEVSTILTFSAVQCLACGCITPGVGAGFEPRLLAFPFFILHPRPCCLLGSWGAGLWKWVSPHEGSPVSLQ